MFAVSSRQLSGYGEVSTGLSKTAHAGQLGLLDAPEYRRNHADSPPNHPFILSASSAVISGGDTSIDFSRKQDIPSVRLSAEGSDYHIVVTIVVHVLREGCGDGVPESSDGAARRVEGHSEVPTRASKESNLLTPTFSALCDFQTNVIGLNHGPILVHDRCE